MSLHNQYCQALTVLGYERTANANTRKYTVFKGAVAERNYYIGHSGAIRLGASIATSISMAEDFKRHLLMRADEHLHAEAFKTPLPDL
jgi:hypothetical protein